MLVVLNIWLDVISEILAAGIVIGFVIPHFIGSVLTGRVRKHFIEDYWDPVAHRAYDRRAYGYGYSSIDDFPTMSL